MISRDDQLIDACYKGNLAEVKKLILEDANPNIQNTDQETPLHWASAKGHTEIVKVLLEAGANVNEKNLFGSTPLHWASERYHTEIVTLLISNKANVNEKNAAGATPLYSTIMICDLLTNSSMIEDKLDVIKVLIANGGKINEENFIPESKLKYVRASVTKYLTAYLTLFEKPDYENILVLKKTHYMGKNHLFLETLTQILNSEKIKNKNDLKKAHEETQQEINKFQYDLMQASNRKTRYHRFPETIITIRETTQFSIFNDISSTRNFKTHHLADDRNNNVNTSGSI